MGKYRETNEDVERECNSGEVYKDILIGINLFQKQKENDIGEVYESWVKWIAEQGLEPHSLL